MVGAFIRYGALIREGSFIIRRLLWGRLLPVDTMHLFGVGRLLDHYGTVFC